MFTASQFCDEGFGRLIDHNIVVASIHVAVVVDPCFLDGCVEDAVCHGDDRGAYCVERGTFYAPRITYQLKLNVIATFESKTFAGFFWRGYLE